MLFGKRWQIALIVLTFLLIVGMVAISSVVEQRVQNDEQFGTKLHQLLLSVDPTPVFTLPPPVDGVVSPDSAAPEAAPPSP